MGSHRVHAPVLRRFLMVLVVVAFVSGLLVRGLGEEITLWLGNVPASDRGWSVIGWLFGGPPLLLAALSWTDRARLTLAQRRKRATLYATWFGLGGFVVPALSGNSVELFGRGVDVGNPLAFGWSCGAVANLAAILFGVAISRLSHRQAVGNRDHSHARALALRFLEWAWILLVSAALLFAAYGHELGFTY